MNHKKIIAAAVSVAALASLAACGGVKDSGSASGNADVITVGTTDKVTSVDPAGSYDNGSYAVQINVFPFLYAQDYNTSELSPDIAADDGTWSDDGTEFTVKIKSGLKFANGHDLTSSDVKFSFDRVNTINDENGPSSLLANIESIDTPDEYDVPVEDCIAVILPLYMASQLYKDDDNGIATTYRNEFEVAREGLVSKMAGVTYDTWQSLDGWA